MKKSMIMLAMVMAIVLVGCGNTTAEAATTVTPAPKAEPKVEVETSKKAPTPEAPKPTEAAKVTEAPKPTEAAKVTEAPKPTAAAKVTETPKPTEAPKEAEQPQKVEAVSIEATVNGTHNVGDTLSAKDFTVTINMSDGSKVKNPAGWTANPLVLSSESTAITVAYNGLSTKITVKANPAAVQQQPTQAQQPAAQQTKKWPASAYEPVNEKAYNDIYDYAYAHGYVEKCDNSTGYNIWYMSKDNDDSCIFVNLTDKGWLAMYWKSKSSGGSYHEEFLGTATLEHVYDYMF